MPADVTGSAALNEPLCLVFAWLRALRALWALAVHLSLKARRGEGALPSALCRHLSAVSPVPPGCVSSLNPRVENYSVGLRANRKNLTGRGLQRGCLIPSAKHFACPFRAQPSAGVFFLSCGSSESELGFILCA